MGHTDIFKVRPLDQTFSKYICCTVLDAGTRVPESNEI